MNGQRKATIGHRLRVARNEIGDRLWFAAGILPWVRRYRDLSAQVADLEHDTRLLIRVIEKLTRPGVIGEDGLAALEAMKEDPS